MPARTTLLDLPTELLDRIYSYLDWDRSTHLIPTRQDVISVSLTCRHLRKTILPLLFRTVSFCLRWHNGSLLEPAILELRRERPDLASYIRCLHLCTRHGRPTSAYRNPSPPLFTVPEGENGWIDMELKACGQEGHYAELYAEHRKRATTLAIEIHERLMERYNLPALGFDSDELENTVRHVVEQTSYSTRTIADFTGLDENTSQEDLELLTDHLQQHQPPPNQLGPSLPLESWLADPTHPASMSLTTKPVKYEIDALAALLLCVPATVTELVCEASVQGHKLSLSNAFPIHVAATALKLFARRLETLTLTTATSGVSNRRGRDSMSDPISPDLIQQLTNVKHLRLAWSPDPADIEPTIRSHIIDEDINKWTSLDPTTLNILEIWNVHVNSQTIALVHNTIKHFPNLKTLRFQNMVSADHGHFARLPVNVPNPPRQGAPTIQETTYLKLAIDLRRSLPHTNITFRGSLTCSSRQSNRANPRLSTSAIRWMENEAIPVGAVIDHQREERLYEDFESFLFLWHQQDGPTGMEAEVDAVKTRAKLVDAAFESRWKVFENVRKDQGEWTTM